MDRQDFSCDACDKNRPRPAAQTGFSVILPTIWPLALFTLAAMAIATWFYRETLD
jgi:hypothetical protein